MEQRQSSGLIHKSCRERKRAFVVAPNATHSLYRAGRLYCSTAGVINLRDRSATQAELRDGRDGCRDAGVAQGGRSRPQPYRRLDGDPARPLVVRSCFFCFCSLFFRKR